MLNKKSFLVLAAMSGLLVAAQGCAHKKDGAGRGRGGDQGEEFKGECHGVNSCKGKGDCGGKGYACAGKNACKGKGWKKLAKKECMSSGGKYKAQ